ncbi:MAG TPA: SGNH/GDSL hydrolase family protein [Syntrophales bacterium]|nr:SGNH/GDSL hydrolase family protein [Syntrophales bacterium]
MRRRPPSIVTELIVMTIAVALVAGGLEGYLRVTTQERSKLYEGIETVPEIADTYYKHLFLEKYAARGAFSGAGYDPQLGWDCQAMASRIRGSRKADPGPARAFRVIALGDGFTRGIEAGEQEHFPHYLEKILRGRGPAEVFNMGVGSYGIDQMLLKYERHGQALRPDVVVLGIFPHDYDRTRLSFYSYAKPVFRPGGATGPYTLENVPVPPPREVCASLKQSLGDPGSYAWVFVKNRFRKLLATLPGGGGYFEETDRLVEYLLERLKGDLDRTGTKLLIVCIPGGSAFENAETLSRAGSEPRAARLRALYKRLEIPCVDLLEAFPAKHSATTVYREFYIHRPDGSIGHFTPRGNAETAKIIAGALRDRGMMQGGDRTIVRNAVEKRTGL